MRGARVQGVVRALDVTCDTRAQDGCWFIMFVTNTHPPHPLPPPPIPFQFDLQQTLDRYSTSLSQLLNPKP